MADANVFRIGEFTAEVRMLNNKLAEAKAANEFLLNTLTSRAHEQLVKDQEHEKTVQKYRQLKAQLGITRQRSPSAPKKSALAQKKKLSSTTTSIAEDSTGFLTDDDGDELPFPRHGGKLQRQQKSEDALFDSVDSLVDLSEHKVLEPEPAVPKKIEEPKPKAPEMPREIGYGLASLRQGTPPPEWEEPQYSSNGVKRANLPSNGVVQRLGGFNITQPSGEIQHVPLPFYQDARTARPPPREIVPREIVPRENYFTDGEHNHLSGLATFIESEDPELWPSWERHAEHSPRHTARQWQEYYEAKVRPAFLKRMEQRAEAAAKVSADFSMENTPDSSETSASVESQIDGEKKDVQAPDESVETVEGAAPSTVTAIRDEQSPGVEPEVKALSQEFKPEDKTDTSQAVAGASKPASPTETALVESSHAATAETSRLSQEYAGPNPAQQLPHVRATMQAKAIVESIPGLSGSSPPVRYRQTSTFHHGGTETDVVVRKIVPRSSFLTKNIIPPTSNDKSPPKSRWARLGQATSEANLGAPGGNDDFSIEDLFAKPKSFHSDPQAFRSVVITIPTGVDHSTALSKIRVPGCKLFSSICLNTSQMRLSPPTTSNSLLVVFVTGDMAQNFIKQQLITPIEHLCSTSQTLVKSTTTLIPTATNPIPRDIQIPKCSRVLWIHCPDGVGALKIPLTAHAIWQSLVRCGVESSHRPMHGSQDPSDGKVLLEFASIAVAKKAHDTVKSCEWDLRVGLKSGYGEDPCGKVDEVAVE
ncbi:uncharacterized protein RCC_04312 [Ramularia collo-cygni]|uniref:DNA-binding protein RAP1 n=1 Tax=Ramularia collo-cygni TaxID=112498 RepID=A0A2D3V1D2_9PEZI|nr:uncharacterized protein RCC_04312 [Ramularia collo-cygni]CZT18467.1 uncharacterized protein RCC_04312 [Ramularia collo-cygni]